MQQAEPQADAAANPAASKSNLRAVNDSRFHKYATKYVPGEREKPGRTSIALPAKSLCELGVPGVKGLTDTCFHSVGVHDPKGVMQELNPYVGAGVTLTLCPDEKFCLVTIPSRPDVAAHKTSQYVVHFQVDYRPDGTVDIKPDAAYDKVSFIYLLGVHGPWRDWLETSYPSWKSSDIMKEWFEQSELPNFIERAQEVNKLTPQSKRARLSSNLQIALDPVPTQTSSPVSTPEQVAVDVRRSKRNKLAFDEVEVEDSDGDAQKIKYVEVSTPEFKDRLRQVEAMEVTSSLQQALSQYDTFLKRVDKDGNIIIPKASKPTAKKKPTGPTKDQVIAKLKSLNSSLNTRLSTAKKAAAHTGDVEAYKTQVQGLQLEVKALKAEVDKLKDHTLDLKSEAVNAKTELAMEKIRTEGRIHQARAEIYAEYASVGLKMKSPESSNLD